MQPSAQNIFADLKQVNGIALHYQITQYVRDLISSGTLQPDDRLPNVRELADLWGTSHYTVQAGITPLVEEGLIMRRPRLGTFVTSGTPPLRRVGIYCNHVPRPGGDDMFTQAATSALFMRLAKEGIHIQAWFDTRPEPEQDAPYSVVAEAIAQRQVQGIVVTSCTRRSADWLQRLDVPVAMLTSRRLPGSVYTDDLAMARLALRRLAERGCRSVGIISHVLSDGMAAAGGPFADVELYSGFWREAQLLGLEVRPEWVIRPEVYPNSVEQAGYDLFQRVLALKDRPDGMFIFSDNLARGVFHAILEDQFDVPGSMRLVVHRNQEVDIFSPVPCDWITVSVQSMANALFEQVQRLAQGKEAPSYGVVPSLSTL